MKSTIPCPTVYPTREMHYADGRIEKQTDVPCEGHLYPCEICGAVRYCGRESHCLDGDQVSHWAQRTFNIGTYYGEGLKGWTRGENWNGWECPRFEFDAAMEVVSADVNQSNDIDEWRLTYNADTDEVILTYNDPDAGAPERFKGEIIETPEGQRKVYAIGAWAWTWERMDLQD